MEPPECFIVPRQEKKVFKFVKSLYGMKQGSKQWHQKFDEIMFSNGFSINEANKCIYRKFVDGKGVIICLYVDDILIFVTELEQVENTKRFLSNNFDMKDVGISDVFLE